MDTLEFPLKELQTERPLTISYLGENIHQNLHSVGSTASFPNDRRLLMIGRQRDPNAPHYVWYPSIKLFDPVLNEHRKFNWIGVERCVAYAPVSVGICHPDYFVAAYRTPKNWIRLSRGGIDGKPRFYHQATFFVLKVDWENFTLTIFAQFRQPVGSTGIVGFCPQRLNREFPLQIFWAKTRQLLTTWEHLSVGEDGRVEGMRPQIVSEENWGDRLPMEYHNRGRFYTWQTTWQPWERPFLRLVGPPTEEPQIIVMGTPPRFLMANARDFIRIPPWMTITMTLFFHWAPPNAFILFKENGKLTFAIADWKSRTMIYHPLPDWADVLANAEHFAVRHITADRALFVDGFKMDDQKIRRHFSMIFEFGIKRRPLPLGLLATSAVEPPNWTLKNAEDRSKLGIPPLTDYETITGIRR